MPLSTQEDTVYNYVKEKESITTTEVMSLLVVKERRARSILSGMVMKGILRKEGASRNTVYVLNTNIRNNSHIKQ